jgi:hypothetical protein
MCARDFRGRCTSALARAPFVSYKSVTFARNRLYESRPLYVFSQRLPNLANGSIDAMLGIVENILCPTCPFFSSSRMSDSMGIRSTFNGRPLRRNSKRELSSSKSPNL